MPIYAFACQHCGHQFDRLQKISDPDPDICPECGQAQIKRQITAPHFRLAGSGWYETDFKSSGEKKHNLAGDAGTDKPAPTAKKESSSSAGPAAGSSS